jgi:membrane-bound metal-dependent hydrolase YbcI (DUF457 family)
MKGIAHFAVGVAAASCFPEVVRAAAAGNPLYFILGGVFGLLPDTLDFKFYRYFFKHDIEIVPDPLKPDPQVIADAMALAANRAFDTGKPVRIKLGTIRLGSDLWQQYEVKFDVSGNRIAVSYGPKVDTGRNPIPGTEPKKRKKASAPLLCGIKLEYEAATTVDIFDGPLFEMEPTKAGRVIPRFIPWHRQWSHSLTAALLFSLTGVLLSDWLAGAVIFSAVMAHALLDQLGFMGNNFLFPFQKRRSEGFKLVHSDQALPNFWTVWLSCLLIFWNLYRALPWSIPAFNLAKLLFYGAVLPAAAGWLLFRRDSTGPSRS